MADNLYLIFNKAVYFWASWNTGKECWNYLASSMGLRTEIQGSPLVDKLEFLIRTSRDLNETVLKLEQAIKKRKQRRRIEGTSSSELNK